MGSFLPASALATFFIFLAPFFSLLLCPFCLILSASLFCLPISLFFPVKNQKQTNKQMKNIFICLCHVTGQNKGNGNVEETAVSYLLPHWLRARHSVCISPHTLYTVCVYSGLIFTCCLREDKIMTPYREKQKRGKRKVYKGKKCPACQFLLVHSGLWMQNFSFPCPLEVKYRCSLILLWNRSSFSSVWYPSGEINPLGKMFRF